MFERRTKHTKMFAVRFVKHVLQTVAGFIISKQSGILKWPTLARRTETVIIHEDVIIGV